LGGDQAGADALFSITTMLSEGAVHSSFHSDGLVFISWRFFEVGA